MKSRWRMCQICFAVISRLDGVVCPLTRFWAKMCRLAKPTSFLKAPAATGLVAGVAAVDEPGHREQ
jgi:hypothetical protein